MINFLKNHRILSIVILLNIIAIIFVVIFAINQTSKTATLDIKIAPNDATITLNGKKYENNQSYDLKPGTYEAVISMDGMITKTETLEITDEAFVRLHTYLLDSAETFDYYKSHQDDFYLLEQIADQSDTTAQEFITKYNQKLDAEASLPITYNESANNGFGFISLYINLASEDNTDQCQNIDNCIIISDTTGGNYDLAISLLKKNQFIIDDYEIIYQTTGKS